MENHSNMISPLLGLVMLLDIDNPEEIEGENCSNNSVLKMSRCRDVDEVEEQSEGQNF